MVWHKQGKIFAPSGEGFFRSHATRPIPYLASPGVLRLLFSSRDADDMPYPAYIDVDVNDPGRVLAIGESPMMPLGRPGAFDDSGVTPVCVLPHEHGDRVYYVGWKRRRCLISIEASIGVARFNHDGTQLSRMFEGPILAQDRNHPLFVAAPFVRQEQQQYKMWYCSGTDWRFPENRPEMIYTVDYAESIDGLQWQPKRSMVIPYRFDGEVVSAPWVERMGDGYCMWYSFRGHSTNDEKNYRIGYAESPDGIHWDRLDHRAGITVSASGWDSEMVCYPSIFRHNDQTYMFYSGNAVGKGGIGFAVAEAPSS